MAAQVEHSKASERAGRAELAHGFSVDLSGCVCGSICLSSSLTLGGGRSSIANGLVSRVGGTSIRTSFFGPVRFPPRTRIVSKVSGLTHRTPSTAGFACPSSSTGTSATPSLSNMVTFLSAIGLVMNYNPLIIAQIEMISKGEQDSMRTMRVGGARNHTKVSV